MDFGTYSGTGIGGAPSTYVSQDFVTIQDVKEHLTAHVRPYVVSTPLGILGRDAQSQWGCRLRTPF